MNGMVRTVLGDVAPTGLGMTYAHEHLILDSPLVADRFPHILLDDVDAAVEELRACAAAGVGSVVDAMPAGGGRDAARLADASRRSGVHVIATTGLHTAKWYPGRSWANEADPSILADLFVADIEEGIDYFDYFGPVVRRTPHRAGLIKVGTSQPEPDDRDRRVFAAAAETHLRTGVPILTHCEEGRGGMEQIELLTGHGVEPDHIVLSHTDKVDDAAYHRDLADAGVMLEFDQGLRHPIDDANPAVTAALGLVTAGRADHLMLATDGARRAMWTAYGGSPGLAALATDLIPFLRHRGVDDATVVEIMVDNPARFFPFAQRPA
jgi:phosphotriesterase-related protein